MKTARPRLLATSIRKRNLAYLRQAVRRIVRQMGPERIVFFGSYAKGRAREGSDLDLLVIARSREHAFERERRVDELLSDRPVAMDILVRTPDEIEAFRWGVDPFCREVLEGGKTLYAARH